MAKPQIHPTAIVHEKAQLGPHVVIGPYCCVGDSVTLHQGVVLHSHVVLQGHTTLGEETEVFPFASLGHVPQDKKYQGEASTLTIGKRNKIREYVTMQPGTVGDRMMTVVGDDGLFMAGVHIAHDCVVGNGVIMANNATLAGHVTIGDHVIIGGLAAIQQFVRIGAYAIIGGLSGVERDVIPFGMVKGIRAGLCGLNLVGLKRHQFSREDIQTLQKVYKDLFQQDGLFSEKISKISHRYQDNPQVKKLLEFIESHESRSFTTPFKISA